MKKEELSRGMAKRGMRSTATRRARICAALCSLCCLTPVFPRSGSKPTTEADPYSAQKVETLRQQVAKQRQELESLRQMLAEQSQVLERILRSLPDSQTSTPKTLNREGILTLGANGGASDEIMPTVGLRAVSLTHAVLGEGESRQPPAKTEGTLQGMDKTARNFGGFRFSGDFRLRADAQIRSGNAAAGPLQNIRSRYRLRINVDKELSPSTLFHAQLSTGPFNNPLTNDQDFSGFAAKHPFSVAEAYVQFQPFLGFALRGGRMEEVFADNMRFLWDDDVRFNGFQQILSIPLRFSPLRLRQMEFRAGEYFLSNPNIVILSPTSPLIAAGYQPGQKVRDAMLFHPGMITRGDLGGRWSHQISVDFQIYRNPKQIQLASTPGGFPVLVSNALGIALSGPLSGVGNGTTTPGGDVYSARDFQIGHVAYRLKNRGWKWGTHEFPVWFDVQASRNMGTSRLRDAVMASVNVGEVKEPGDTRFLYQFAIKDANSLISQFTDDDLGTGSGVNIAVHAVRLDLGLTRFLQWQNLFFIQNERRPSNPADQFFVPLQRGARTTFRYLGQLAFTF